MTSGVRSVSRAQPCAICEATHGCSRTADGLLMCRRRTGPQTGFVYLNQSRGDSAYALYRREGDPHLNGHDERSARSSRPNKIDWPSKAAELQSGLRVKQRRQLAEALGLPEAVLALLAIGWTEPSPHRDTDGGCWTFPEVDGAGKVVGITCRYTDGCKKAWPGGQRGLTVPTGWPDRDGPVLVVEGASDVLALTALGLPVLGRPNNTVGAEQLAALLRDLPADREIVVLGEMDPKPDGRWPGKEGAAKVSGELASLLKRPVLWTLPPDGAKDARAWLAAQDADLSCADGLEALGQTFVSLLKRQPATAASRSQGWDWQPIDIAEIEAADYRLTWLVQRVLVANQPIIIGGPRKCLKTNLLVDLAVSLASGTDFLGHFKVYEPKRVVMLSGESGDYVLRETVRRVCAARDLSPADLSWRLAMQFALPQLSHAEHMDRLRAGLERQQVEFLIVDPLYLSLLAGSGGNGPRPENLYEMGPLFAAISQACLSVGCTPALAHHSRRGASASNDPLELDDLAYAGVAEFARQWVLVNRRERFDPKTGTSRLWLNVGGSAGHGGLWAVDVVEGRLSDDFTGRQWAVSVETASEAREAEQDGSAAERKERRAKGQQDDEFAVLKALDELDRDRAGAVTNRVRNLCGLSRDRVDQAIARLVSQGVIAELTVSATVGNGAARAAAGIRRVRE
ncbi:MAG: AAA family ATPase [Planctomycetia bacterium]|nr:AAA family ATPase [Planctomycetia bacterium]